MRKSNFSLFSLMSEIMNIHPVRVWYVKLLYDAFPEILGEAKPTPERHRTVAHHPPQQPNHGPWPVPEFEAKARNKKLS